MLNFGAWCWILEHDAEFWSIDALWIVRQTWSPAGERPQCSL